MSLTRMSKYVTMSDELSPVELEENMVFAEKLKMIMQLTSTTNSRLAAAINVDPSLISRLKSGDRFISSKSDYLSLMAEYFGSKCNDSFKSLTMLELLGAEFGDDIVSALELWFLDDSMEPSSDEAARFLNLTQSTGKKRSISGKYAYFHGDNAISEAIELVSTLTEEKEGIKKVKILSNCKHDPTGVDLFDCCSDFLLSLASGGAEILRVVPNYTDLGCAVKDVFSWFPILEAGKLKSYYYNDLKEGIYNNLVFVVPGAAVMISDSVGTGGVLPTFVSTDSAVISDYDRLFDEYVSFCTQGVRCEPNSFLSQAMTEFFARKEDCCNVFGSLPFEWLPEDFITNEKEKSFLRKMSSSVREMLKTNALTEIFPLLTPNEIMQGEALFLAGAEKRKAYTVKQYYEHLVSILRLLEEEPNYTAFPMRFNEGFRENILIKRSSGAIKLPKPESSSFGIIDHPSSVSALWQYFMNDARFNRTYLRQHAIEEIKMIAEELKK